MRPVPRNRLLILAGAMLLALPAFAGSSDASGRFERTLKVSGTVDLYVESGVGNITIRAGDASSVHVVGIIKSESGWFGRSSEEKVRAIESNPPIEQTGNTIRIGHINDSSLKRNISITYEIVAPADSRLEASSGVGDIKVEGLRQDIRASSGTGSIRLTGLAGEVKASSGVGDIEVRGAKGGVRVSTGTGSIRVEGEPTSMWKISTGLGDVSVRLPADAKFDLHARTGMGSIHTNHPITVEGGFLSSKVQGKVRGGGPLVDISSGLGSLRIE